MNSIITYIHTCATIPINIHIMVLLDCFFAGSTQVQNNMVYVSKVSQPKMTLTEAATSRTKRNTG